MIKSIRLKLLTLKYSGNSIGDDIHLEIEISNQFLRINKKIKVEGVEKRLKNCHSEPIGEESRRFLLLFSGSFASLRMTKNVFLQTQFINSKSVESLPAYVRIKFEQILNGREYFTILEGSHRGRSASVY